MKKLKQTRLKGFSLIGSSSVADSEKDARGFESTPNNANISEVTTHESIRTEVEDLANTIPEITPEQKTNANQRKFQEKWKEEFQWILYEDRLARCKFCMVAKDSYKTSVKFSEGFSGPFKRETFKFHDDSNQHKKNVDCAKNSNKKATDSSLAKCIKKMDDKMFKQLEVLFNLSYYIAKNNKPFSDIESLAVLSRKLEIDLQNQYANRNACIEFISCIAQVIKESLLKEIAQSQFISLILDASTDKGTVEELVIYIRYIKNGEIKECFLGLVELQNSTAESYFLAIDKLFNSLDLNLKEKDCSIVGLATDGARNMTGEIQGVCARFKDYFPYLISVHCVAHRLQLSVLDALKNIDYLEKFDAILILIYKFYGNSSKK